MYQKANHCCTKLNVAFSGAWRALCEGNTIWRLAWRWCTRRSVKNACRVGDSLSDHDQTILATPESDNTKSVEAELIRDDTVKPAIFPTDHVHSRLSTCIQVERRRQRQVRPGLGRGLFHFVSTCLIHPERARYGLEQRVPDFGYLVAAGRSRWHQR